MREREEVYLDGNPDVDSTRRHMERVLKGSPRPRRWPWLAVALGGGSVWMLWRLGQGAARARQSPGNETTPSKPTTTDATRA
ncbi:MAG TPA: hypothetical protein VL484_08175 [Vicinamibacterales bacterium]|jgi:hypothetical protein|nr:hypothetical protein [Vicinamibacterales bacterium]